MSDAAELSSIHTSLDELTKLVTVIAERRDIDPEDTVSTALFEVERSLRTASRQLERLMREL